MSEGKKNAWILTVEVVAGPSGSTATSPAEVEDGLRIVEVVAGSSSQ
jgi:hypothetical protein